MLQTVKWSRWRLGSAHALRDRQKLGQEDAGMYPDGSVLANAGSQTNDSVLYSALLQEGSMADNGISNLGAHNLGRWQEAWGCVDGRLGVVELKLGWLQCKAAA